jgi:hypothetical protein
LKKGEGTEVCFQNRVPKGKGKKRTLKGFENGKEKFHRNSGSRDFSP